MKSLRFLPLLGLATLSCIPNVLPAVEAVKFEAVLYLFRTESIPKIDFSKALRGRPPLSGEGIVVTPPATIVFDQEVLVLDGGGYTWNGGQAVPARFSETKLPVMVTPAGQSATVRIDVPVQYMERMPDGSLQLREIPRESAVAPRYQLTLAAQPASEAPHGYDLKVTCQMDICTLQGREKIPGVDLDVGRPITARFDRKIEYWARKGEWFGIMAGQKESGDFTLQVLLKVSSTDGTPGSGTGAKGPVRPASAAVAGPVLGVNLRINGPDSQELTLALDRRGADSSFSASRDRPRFGVTLKGRGPVYHDVVVGVHGTQRVPAQHRGTVTIEEGQQWATIDLEEIVSRPGETLRSEPCPANGKYPVLQVNTGADLAPDRPGREFER